MICSDSIREANTQTEVSNNRGLLSSKNFLERFRPLGIGPPERLVVRFFNIIGRLIFFELIHTHEDIN